MATLHLVPHTHWDREWYLPFQSFRIKLVHLIDVLLDILDRDPSFVHFTLDGQTILLEDYLEIRPEREADLIHHIRSGRLVIGPWYILPDEFLVSPEATVRNLLQGRDICNRFGARMDIGYLPDPFGHIGQMPQILKGFGIRTAIFRRGLADENCELWWQSPDETCVLTSYLRDSYDNAARLPTDSSAFEDFIRERRDSLTPFSAVSHLLLLNGTDHQEPQPEVPALIAGLKLDDDELFISTLPAYMIAIQEEIDARDIKLPIVQGELRNPKRHHLLAGVLSSRVRIKQRNHDCETLLERWAEPFSSWAEIVQGDKPDRTVWTGHMATPSVRHASDLLKHAWRQLLKCHPHDSICGCSVDQVHKEMYTRFDQVEQIGEEITRQSLTTLAEAVDTSALAELGARSTLIVFNPNLQTHTGRAIAHLELPAGLDSFEIVDHEGRSIPYRVLERHDRTLADMELDLEGLMVLLKTAQDGKVMGLSVQEVAIVIQDDHALIDIVLAETAEPNQEAIKRGAVEIEEMLSEGKVSKFRLVARFATEVILDFIATEIPGHGYRTLGLRPVKQSPTSTSKMQDTIIENNILRVEAGLDGNLTMTDLRTGVSYPRLLHFSDQADRGDSYTFCPVDSDIPFVMSSAPTQIRRRVDECKQALEMDFNFQLPANLTEDRSARSENMVNIPVQVRVLIMAGVPRVDLEIHLNNTAKDHRLQLLFSSNLKLADADYDGHYEIVRRSTSPPKSDPGWVEQPTVEKPVRNFVVVNREGKGLMVAMRGLREAYVSPEGVITITLLRCFGWLSRNDLATRKGDAGPQIPTPEGQMSGDHTFHLSLIPFTGEMLSARTQALAFQTTLRAVGTPLHKGILPASASMLAIDSQAFDLTCVKTAEDGLGLIVRGVNLGHQMLNVNLDSLFEITSAFKARIDETPLETLEISDSNRLSLEINPHEIITLRLNVVCPAVRET